jgi:hypothetical protein
LLEEEYMAAMVHAEIAWLRSAIDDLRAGRLKPPTEAEMRRLASLPGAPSEAAPQHAVAQQTATTSSRRHAKSTRPRARSQK